MDVLNEKLDTIIDYLKNIEILLNKNDKTELLPELLPVLNESIYKNNIKKNISFRDFISLPKDDIVSESRESYEITESEYGPKYKDIKQENIELEETFVRSCLLEANISNDIKMFRKIYIDDVPKEYYPIRHIKKRTQYWLDGHMNDDDDNYVRDTIIKNISMCYLKINLYENYTNDIEQFLKNQDHINNMSDTKYKDKFFNNLLQIINI